MSGRIVLVSAAAVVAAAAASIAVLAGGPVGGQAERGDETAPSTSTAEVSVRDLTEREELDGTLGYGQTSELVVTGQGTLTSLADEGSTVDRGGVLAEVDGEPVVLLFGERAAWRALDTGSSDGADIRQLEENLVALGHGTAERLGVDEDWTWATTATVKAWQADLGVEKTGAVDLGSVVFAPSAVRIAGHLVEEGAPAGSPSFEVTGTTRVVTVDLAADRQGLVEPGRAVEIQLPGGSVVDGLVYSVSTVVEPPAQDGGDPTVEVVVAFVDPAGSGTLDQAPVDVDVVTVAVEDALTVPVEALLALAEGGYALERPDGTLVAVEVGAFADGFVEVTGDLAEGDRVVVA